jgi:hypothetical protein
LNRNLVILFILLCSNLTLAQSKGAIQLVGQSKDSVPEFMLDDFTITPMDADFRKEYNSAKYYAMRVYEYAMIASEMLNEFEDSLTKMDKSRDRNKYLKQINKFLKDEFGDEIAKMSINRGKVLMKIIHKETGLTAYEIIKNYKGGTSAVMWQGTVKMFGTTLKYEYQPKAEDRALAKVLEEIEQGKIKPYPRPPKTDIAKDVMSRKDKRQKKRETKNIRERNRTAARQD